MQINDDGSTIEDTYYMARQLGIDINSQIQLTKNTLGMPKDTIGTVIGISDKKVTCRCKTGKRKTGEEQFTTHHLDINQIALYKPDPVQTPPPEAVCQPVPEAEGYIQSSTTELTESLPELVNVCLHQLATAYCPDTNTLRLIQQKEHYIAVAMQKLPANTLKIVHDGLPT